MKEINLTDLTQVSGLTGQEIKQRLEELKILFTSYPHKREPYFLFTFIDINSRYPIGSNRKRLREETQEKVRRVLGYPHHFRINDFFYYADYKINPEFDINQLDKRITFRNGLLVESTQIMF